MYALLLLSTFASADDSPGAFVLPGATPMTDDHLEAGAGAGVLQAAFVGACDGAEGPCDASSFIGGVYVEVRGQPVRPLRLHAAALALTAGEGAAFQGDVSVTVVDLPHVHLAPFLGVMALPDLDGALAGLALDAGGSVATFDLELPLLGGTLDDGVQLASLPDVLALTEAGVTFHLSPTQGLRVGMESLLPGVGYRGEFGPVFVEARLHLLGVVNAGMVEVGFHI